MRAPLTTEEIRALPPTLNPATAGQLLGIGRTTTYTLLRTGHFPAPAFQAGRRWRIPTAGILALLGIAYPPGHSSPPPDNEQDTDHDHHP